MDEQPPLFPIIPIINQSYQDILLKFNIKNYHEKDYYLQIGQIDQLQGWIFHISVLQTRFIELLEKLIPFFINKKITFCIPKNYSIFSMLQSGSLGYENIGKAICIYTNTETNILELADSLILFTKHFIGSAVLTDIHLGNCVYTRYGSFSEPNINGIKTILDPSGNKILDVESIPCALPPWISWPFESISKQTYSKEKKIINDTYLIQKVIKNDYKGRVMVALYQKNLLSYKKCVIKEGKIGMAEDENGRTIKERLLWQKQIHNKLSGKVQLPNILDLFSDNDNTYLVTELIKGENLSNVINNLFQGRSYKDISIEEQECLLEILINLLEQIKLLHQCGIIHRDLNIENFLIEKNNKVWLIDMELSYDKNLREPTPAFEMGTYGYMSPEQINLQLPTEEQDIYSLGAIMLVIFTQLPIIRFNINNNTELKKNISYFIENSMISDIISQCLHYDPHERPTIEHIIRHIEKYKDSIGRISQTVQIPENYIDSLTEDIKIAVNSLDSSQLVNNQGYWVSPIDSNGIEINPRSDRKIYLGYERGISGILFLIGLAKEIGFEVSTSLTNTVNKNFALIRSQIIDNENGIAPNLFSGKIGIGIAINMLIQSNTIEPSKDNKYLLKRCFENLPDSLDLSKGLAGYGTSLLKCLNNYPQEFYLEQLNTCVNIILQFQNKNGSWSFPNIHSKKNEIYTGFFDGISGISWFLLNLYDQNLFDRQRNEFILDKALKSLEYLIKATHKYKNEKYWTISDKNKDIQGFSNSSFFMLLPFIKAYEITKNEIYKNISESILSSYPSKIKIQNISILNGLAGLGEVYLYAWKIFTNEKWLIRATWIANVFKHTIYKNENGKLYWIQNDPRNPYADLLIGNCGILYFLIHYTNREKMGSIF